MKKQISTALFACVAAVLSACKDENATTPPAEAADAPPTAPAEPPAEAPVASEEPAAAAAATPAPEPDAPATDTAPGTSEVRALLLPLLADYPALTLTQLQVDSTPQAEDGSFAVAVRVQVRVAENLYARENAPEVFNEERRAVNEAMNLAMMPESHYLLQVGASPQEITPDDRRLHALPAELQQLADELKALAEQPVYYLRVPAGAVLELAATLSARRSGGHWELSELRFDTAPLRAMAPLIPEKSLPADAAKVGEGFEAARRESLREKIAAFNSAAAPCIQAREGAARERVLRQRARDEEAAKAEAEQTALQAAAREQWGKICSTFMRSGIVFSGEWKRGDSFGRLALRIVLVQSLPDSLQFTGVLYDPTLPQIELQVAGRLQPADRPDAPAPAVIHIYNGRYDPDSPIAEAFDAQDAMLKLHLSQSGAAKGVLTCAAWASSPEKDFSVSLSHTPRRINATRK